MTKIYCESCKGSHYGYYLNEASIQLCGFWLCRKCHSEAIKKSLIVLILTELKNNGISHCYDAIWGNRLA
jgi:hypothetical protein